MKTDLEGAIKVITHEKKIADALRACNTNLLILHARFDALQECFFDVVSDLEEPVPNYLTQTKLEFLDHFAEKLSGFLTEEKFQSDKVLQEEIERRVRDLIDEIEALQKELIVP